MDTRRWALLRDPFGDLAETARPYVLNASFQSAYNNLLSATRAGRGCLLLTGARGLGKTTLLRYLLRGLPFAGIAVEVFPPRPQMGVRANDRDRKDPQSSENVPDADMQVAWSACRERLARQAQDGRQIVLAVDDAHRLPDQILLDMLSLPAATRRLGVAVSVLLAGPRRLAPRVADLARACGCEIDVHATLTPLSSDELAAYLAEAMSRAGSRAAAPFPADSIARLKARTNGVLADVNRVCARALSIAEDAAADKVMPETIDRAADELQLDQAPANDDAEALTPHLHDRASENTAALPSQAEAGQAHPFVPGVSGEQPLPEKSGAQQLQAVARDVQPAMTDPVLAGLPLAASASGSAGDGQGTDARQPPPDRRFSRRTLAAALAVPVLLVGAALAWPVLREYITPPPETTLATAGTRMPQDLSADTASPQAQPVAVPTAPPAAASRQSDAPEAAAAAPPAGQGAGADRPDNAPALPVTAAVAPQAQELQPAPQQPQQAQELQPEQRAVASVSPHAGQPPASSSPPALEDAEAVVLMARGREMLEASDAVSARLFYERAAGRNHIAAMTAMAWTYDPLVLAQRDVRGVPPEPQQAIMWYRRALAAGDTAAAPYLRALVGSMRASKQLDEREAAAALAAPGSYKP